MNVRLFAAAALVTVFVLSARQLPAADAAPAKVKFADLPAAVQKALQAETNGAKIDSVSEETDHGKPVYVAFVTIDSKHYGVKVAKDGSLVEKALDLEAKAAEIEISLADAPQAVQKTFKEEALGSALGTVLKTTADGKTLYGTTITRHDKPYWLTVAADGTLVEKRLDLPVEEEETEVARCPEAVRELLKEETAGGKIVQASKITEGDKSVYHFAVLLGNKPYMLSVDEKGTLLEKKLEIEPERAVVQFSECPAAVQKTLRRETEGKEIEIVSKETAEDGKSLYAVDVKIGEQVYELQVAEDGTLIFKGLMPEESDK